MNKYKEGAELAEEGAKLVEGRMTFIADFLENRKYGFGILFFVLLILGVGGCWWFNERGKKEGAKSAQIEIAARKAIRKQDSATIEKLRSDITQQEIQIVQLKAELEKKQDFSQLKKTFQQKLDEADEISRMLTRELKPDTKKLNKNLKKITTL